MDNLNFNQKQKMGVNVSLENTTSFRCENCNCEVFSTAYHLRKVSKLLTGDVRDNIVTIPVFVCVRCYSVNKELLPSELKDLIKDDI